MATKLIHKNSKVQFKNATGAQLEFGELAINYHSSGPYLQAKGEDGEVHSLGGVYIGSSAPGNPLPGRWWFDDANSKLFLYDGSAWQVITGSSGGGSSTTVVGGDGIIATTSGSTATVAIDLASSANGLVISSGKLQANIATTSALGTVKVGTGLAVADDGTLSATGGGGGEDNPTAELEWQADDERRRTAVMEAKTEILRLEQMNIEEETARVYRDIAVPRDELNLPPPVSAPAVGPGLVNLIPTSNGGDQTRPKHKEVDPPSTPGAQPGVLSSSSSEVWCADPSKGTSSLIVLRSLH